jgi:hypothetical protein
MVGFGVFRATMGVHFLSYTKKWNDGATLDIY